MDNTSIAFLLTFLAGFSTLIGTIPIFINFKNENKLITASLAFAAGVMLSVSITDLIPESFKMLSSFKPLLTLLLSLTFIILGILCSNIIDRKILLQTNKNSLYKVGLISMLAIILHNIPEGIATFISTTKNTSLGLSLSIAIALHNIPEGISISIPIYYAKKSHKTAFLYTFISAMSEPLGAIITYLFLTSFINDTILGLLFAFIAGIMIQISLSELLPTSLSYNENKLTRNMFIIGFVFMLIKFLL